MSKPPTKLPVNRNKPVGRSISAADVAGLVRSATARQRPAEPGQGDAAPSPRKGTGKPKRPL